MSSVRSRGRPGRDAGDLAGRERLLKATRERMRQRPPIKLHRRSIADAAGVAPGLVTYYFRDESSLIEAAARPVIDGYLARLRTALSRNDSLEESLRVLVRLLIEIAQVDGQLLDTYIQYIKEQNVPHKKDILAGSFGMMDALFRLGLQSGAFREVNTAFMATALWGVCKTAAQLPELAVMLQNGDSTVDGNAVLCDQIMDLLCRILRVDPAPADPKA